MSMNGTWVRLAKTLFFTFCLQKKLNSQSRDTHCLKEIGHVNTLLHKHTHTHAARISQTMFQLTQPFLRCGAEKEMRQRLIVGSTLHQSQSLPYCTHIQPSWAKSAVSRSLVAYWLVMPGCCHVQESPNWLVQERGRDGVSRREERERERVTKRERARADTGEIEAASKDGKGWDREFDIEMWPNIKFW